MKKQFTLVKKKLTPAEARARRESAIAMAKNFSEIQGSTPQISDQMEIGEPTRSPTRSRDRVHDRVKGSSLIPDVVSRFGRKGKDVQYAQPMEEDSSSENEEEEAVMTAEYSRDRRDISRGKRPAREELFEENVVPEARRPSRKDKKEPTPEDLYKMFQRMKFVGTRYPHRETMKKLGIARDVEFLFEMCHLDTFMRRHMEAYEEETCFFLSSLKVHFYEEEQEYASDGGLGFITFTVRDYQYSLTFKEIEKLYGFQEGTGTSLDVEKTELQALWKTIAGNKTYSSTRSKGAEIRSPVIRYVHKSLASTLFARKETGNINESEIQLLDVALCGILNTTRDGTALAGDRSNTSLTFVLLDQLMFYKEWVVKANKRRVPGEISIGGIITPILVACNVDLLGKEHKARWIDIGTLTRTHFLDGETDNGMYLYKFIHPAVGQGRMILPSTEATKIRMGNNIDFWPPTELLYDPNSMNVQQEEEIEQDEEIEQEQTEKFHFEEYTAPAKQSVALKEAHKRISLLQRWNKFQDRTIKALKSTVRELTGRMKNQEDHMKELQQRIGGFSSSSATQAPFGMGRSSSTRETSRINIPFELPRASFEPRRRGASSLRPRRSHPINPPDQPHDHPIGSMIGSVIESPPEGNVGTEIVPSYTRDSMDDAITSYFTQP